MKQDDTQLNTRELALLQDAKVLPLKHSVQQKLEQKLIQTGNTLKALKLSLEWESKAPKLSRGENYAQQAYRVMDFPRIQEEGGFLFYRTLVLWGHPIGAHLIVSGHFMERLVPRLLNNYQQLAPHWLLAAQDSPWIWESEAEGLLVCSTLSEENLNLEIEKRKFFKLSSFLPLDQYDRLADFSRDRWAELHHLLLAPEK